jgi:hypothetical protein
MDGFSRFLVHWNLRESMRAADVEVILEGAKKSTRKQSRESSPTMARSLSLSRLRARRLLPGEKSGKPWLPEDPPHVY